jgi:class 3 adenylate cyclase
VIEDDGDLFGTTVNVAARVASVASGGESVISESARARVDVATSTSREVDLKGVPEPMRVHVLAV